mgnify:CR=1 FL=1
MRRADEILHDVESCMGSNCHNCPDLNYSSDPRECAYHLLKELSNLITFLEKSSTCTFGESVSVKLDGIHELSPHPLKLSQRLKNVTVEILECPKCGETSVGWYRQANTEEID